MSLRFFLVNDYNIHEVFELTGEEMGELAAGGAIFMCYKDSIRISNEVPYGVMAFHPALVTEDGEFVFKAMVESIEEVRAENKTTHEDDPLISAGGHRMRVPVYAGDLSQN